MFITPCTKPTRIHCATSFAVRWQTSAYQATMRFSLVRMGGSNLGKCPIVKVDQLPQQGRFATRGEQLEMPKSDEGWRHATQIAPGSIPALPS